jgi:hypothetical protein
MNSTLKLRKVENSTTEKQTFLSIRFHARTEKLFLAVVLFFLALYMRWILDFVSDLPFVQSIEDFLIGFEHIVSSQGNLWSHHLIFLLMRKRRRRKKT